MSHREEHHDSIHVLYIACIRELKLDYDTLYTLHHVEDSTKVLSQGFHLGLYTRAFKREEEHTIFVSVVVAQCHMFNADIT